MSPRSILVVFIQFLWPLALCAQIQYPPNLYLDSLYAPFNYGVASGDPLSDRVLLWTKLDPQGAPDSLALDWEVATDDNFSNVVASGTVQARASRDWTAMVDAGGLSPDTRYYYRFIGAGNKESRIGRTRTAPAGPASHLRFAVASCSSVFSGYFNAYARIAERDNLNLVIHLGDYIYDTVDQDQQDRVPVPPPLDPASLAEFRDRHAYYLLDPDLRAARQMHPWTVIWDNHDIDADGNPQVLAEAMQAFHDYIPIRTQDPAHPEIIYRRLAYGDLVDILMIDAQSLRDVDSVPGAGEISILGDAQWSWISQQIASSTAQWRLIGNQKMMSALSLGGFPSFIPFGDGPVADSSAWDGYNADRVRLLNALSQHDNNIVVSGDIHMSYACDMAPDPAAYNSQTGAGSVAVEFLPTSISRANFDERGFGGFLTTLAQTAMSLANPHHVFSELESHGYGILDIRPDSVVAEFWYSPILQVHSTESFEVGYVCRDGANHWDRNARSTPLVAVDLRSGATAVQVAGPFPNPGRDRLRLLLELDQGQEVDIRLLDLGTGRELRVFPMGKLAGGKRHQLEVAVRGLPAGVYGLVVEGTHFRETRKWVLTP